MTTRLAPTQRRRCRPSAGLHRINCTGHQRLSRSEAQKLRHARVRAEQEQQLRTEARNRRSEAQRARRQRERPIAAFDSSETASEGESASLPISVDKPLENEHESETVKRPYRTLRSSSRSPNGAISAEIIATFTPEENALYDRGLIGRLDPAILVSSVMYACGTAREVAPAKREPRCPIKVVDGWHAWDTDEVCNAERWAAGKPLISRRACRAQEHPAYPCREFYEGSLWVDPRQFPNRQDQRTVNLSSVRLRSDDYAR